MRVAVGIYFAVFVANASVAQPTRTPTDENEPKAEQKSPPELVMEDEFDAVELLELDIPIVVTASRHEQSITDVPYAISVITADDIRRSGARSIPDALRLAPGVDIAELSYGNYAVSPRGFASFNANKVLVLVDGRQIYDTLMSGTFWGAWPFQLEDIDQIEVIRGPAGVTWGANAVNGVINIITKDPDEQEGLTVSVGGGSRDTYKERVSYGLREGDLRLRFSAEHESSGGFKESTSAFGNLDDEYRNLRLGLHAIYEPDDENKYTYSVGSAVVDGNWPLPLASRLFRNPKAHAQANYVLGKWTHYIEEDNAFELTGYVNDFYLTSGLDWTDFRYQQLSLLLSHTFKPAEDQTFIWGLDTRWDLTSAANADPFMLAKDVVRSGSIGLYAQHEWRVAPLWMLHLGGRVEYDFYGGFHPTGRIALARKLEDGALVYGAVSRAFHMPAGPRRFLDFPVVGEFLQVTSERGLDPETLIAYEVGYRTKWWDRFDVDVNVFWNRYDDLLETIPELGPPGILQLKSKNGRSLSLYGVELGLKYAVSDSLTLLGNYTFQQTDTGLTELPGDAIYPPRHKFMAAVRYDVSDFWHLSSQLYYVGGVNGKDPSIPFITSHVGSYVRLDLGIIHEFDGDDASIAFGVRNLLDPDHPEGVGTGLDSAEVPRSLYVEYRVKIN